jgi:hypothetical protein
MVRALIRQPTARLANVIAFSAGAVMIAAAPVAAAMAGMLILLDGKVAGLPRLAPLGVIEVGVALLVIGFTRRQLADRRAARMLTLGFGAAPPQRKGSPAECRACGGGLADPGPRALLTRCVYCGVENLRVIDLTVQAAIVERFSGRAASPADALREPRRARRRALVLGVGGAVLVLAGVVWQRAQPEQPERSTAVASVPHDDDRRRPGAQRAVTAGADAVELVEHAAVAGTVLALVPGAGGEVTAVVADAVSSRVIEGVAGAVSAGALRSAPELPPGQHYARRSPADPWLIARQGALRCLASGGAMTTLHGDRLLDDPLLHDVAAGPGCSALLTTRASADGHFRLRHAAPGATSHVRSDMREAQLSPDGSTVAAAVLVHRPAERFHLAVFPRATPGEARLVTEGAGHAALPTWSPDGKRLAFLGQPVRDGIQHGQYTGSAHLFTTDLEGRVQQLTAGRDLARVRPVWTDRGIFVVALEPRSDSRIYRVVGRR